MKYLNKNSGMSAAPYSASAAARALMLSLFAYLLWAEAANAAAIGSGMGSVLCALVAIIQGTPARALATLAVIALGVGALLGRVTYGQATIIAAGIGAIFGAAGLASILASSVVSVNIVTDCNAALTGNAGWTVN